MTDFADINARVTRLEDNIDGFAQLQADSITLGEIQAKLEALCVEQNRQTGVLVEIQKRTHALETDGPPVILSVGPPTVTLQANPAPDPDPPVAAGTIPDQTATVGTSILPLNASGYFTSTLSGTYASAGLPAGVTIDAATGIISGTPTAEQVATSATVTFTTTAGSASQTFDWTVNAAAAPDPPVATGTVPDQISEVGQPLTALQLATYFTSTLSGTYTITGGALPVGVSINSITGVVTGNPTTVQAATSVTVAFTTTAGSASQTFDWTTTATAAPPTLNGAIPDQNSIIGTAITALDLSGYYTSTLTGSYSVTTGPLPDGLTLNTSTGVITGTPTTSGGPTAVGVTFTTTAGSVESLFAWTVAAPVGFELVQFTYRDTPTTAQVAELELARDRINRVLPSPLAAVTHNGDTNYQQIEIEIRLKNLDGAGNRAAQATWSSRSATRGGLPVTGFIEFDTADLETARINGWLKELTEHEICHVLGMGTLTTLLEFGPLCSGGSYTGANAVAEYSTITGNAETSIPMQAGCAHFDETTFGYELNTPFISTASDPLSRMSLGVLEDLGYSPDYAEADAYVLGIPSTLPPSGGRCCPSHG